jgi:serine/threonine protein kinase/Tfp pilus assembly protein PilF
MGTPRANLKSIFGHAMALSSPSECEAYLQEACAGDPELRAELESLLQAHHDAGFFLAERKAGPVAVTAHESISERPGTFIGPYKLLEQIGEGGFGVVFMSQQQEPIRRKVALKVLKPGMDTRQVIARFEAERQALALMDHPNIAKVLDAGQTPSGRPYFVMDLVSGLPITDFCDQQQLTPRERLELFVSVCEAVQHAHHKGIIHRDLKPSNVLVTMQDGAPLVKVIDFGIAKALGQELTDKTLFTGFAQIIGTPLYMSPEQAAPNSVDVDTRSDIYSLGVVLYELLTGKTPFDKERLREAGLEEIRRIIREEEPPRPSTRVSTLGQAASTISSCRKSDPKRLSQLLRGELDWIVMKALDKDRKRRYETASAFAADVQRYLHDEPVQACPPSGWYRFRKFTRRNKAAVLTTLVALALLMVAGAGLWSWQHQETLRRAENNFHTEQRRGSVEASLEQLKELHRRALWPQAEKLLDQAEQQVGSLGDAVLGDKVAQTRRGTVFLKRLDEIRLEKSMIVQGKMDFAGALPKYRQAFLENGLDLLHGDPALLAAKLNASEYRDYLLAALDDWALEEGADNRQRIMGITATATSQAWRRQLSESWDDGIDLAEIYDAIPEKDRTPAIICLVASRLNNLGQDGAGRLERGLRQYPGDFWLHFFLGVARHDLAIGAFRAALAIRPGTGAAHNSLGNALCRKKAYDAGIAEYEEAIRLEPKHAFPHISMGDALREKKEYNAAVAEFQKAMHLDPKLSGPHNGLGNVLWDKKEYDAAIREYQEAIRLGPKDPTPHVGMGNVLHDKKEFDEAIREYKEAIRLGPNMGNPHNSMGYVLREKKKYDAAIAEFRKAMELEPELAAMAHYGIGYVLYEKKAYDAAIFEYEEAIRLDPKLAAAYNGWGNVLWERKELEAASAKYQEAIRLDPKFAQPHIGLGNVLGDKEDYKGAIREFEEATRLDPSDARPHFNLGTLLYGRKQFDAAIREFKAAIQLDRTFAAPHVNLGNIFRERKEYAAAIDEFNEAIRLDPDFAFAHANLGLAYRNSGRFRESVSAFGQALKLSPKDARTEGELRLSEQLLIVDERFSAVREGRLKPNKPSDAVGYALFDMEFKKEYALAVRLFVEGFAADAKLTAAHRYNAACAASLAAAGQGKDADKLDDNQRADLRNQALGWLRDELQAARQALQANFLSATAVRRNLQHWRSDPDLLGVREPKELARLPEGEQQSWQQLWSAVDDLLKQATAAFTETNHSGTLTAKDSEQVHEVKMSAGKTYAIDLTSEEFDTYLRLESAQGKVLAENDDIDYPKNLNSRILFTPQEDGLYRLVATSFQRRGRGAYTLTIREFQRKKE